LIEIINKQLLLQLVGYLCYWQMGFNSVFKGLISSSLTVSVTQFWTHTRMPIKLVNAVNMLVPFGRKCVLPLTQLHMSATFCASVLRAFNVTE